MKDIIDITPDFKSLEGKELIVNITGEMAVKSNIHDYHDMLKRSISGINMDLVTDNDFAEAELNVKTCELLETRIANARQDALMRNTAIAEIVTVSNVMQEEVRQIRLILGKSIKTEKENRRNSIINNGRKLIIGLAEKSQVKHGFAIDFTAIQSAVKGKRSLSAMEEAVNLVVEQEKERLETLERLYTDNLETIQAYEIEHIGLAPDKKTLALSPSEIIETELTNRILKRKIAAQEKAEAERKAKEEQERKPVVDSIHVFEKKPDTFVVPPLPDDPFTEWNPKPKTYTLTVEVECDQLSPILMRIHGIEGVISVQVVE